MRACICRIGIQRTYGIDLTWSERDVDFLHRVAIDISVWPFHISKNDGG